MIRKIETEERQQLDNGSKQLNESIAGMSSFTGSLIKPAMNHMEVYGLDDYNHSLYSGMLCVR